MKMFPILKPWRESEKNLLKALGCPDSVPWEKLEPHEAQAQRNHSQSLKRLAERGGLSACEAIAVLEDRPWHRMPDQLKMVLRLIELTK